MKTVAVRGAKGRIECLWYPPFVGSRTIPQLYAAIQHEIEHLVRMHLARYSKKYNALLWNLAIDMCVNGLESNPRIGCLDNKLVMPISPEEGKLIFIPATWKSDESAEYYYSLIEKDPKFEWARKLAKKQSFYDGMVDDHSLWKKSDMSEDELRQLVKDITVQAIDRSQGRIPGHLAGLLERLNTPIISWRHMLRQYFGHHLGNRRKTYSRRDRRQDIFGLPGISHHAAAKVSVIVDTSGSISTEDLEQFFAEIEAIAYRASVCILQWDSKFQSFTARYRRGKWKNIKIKGKGGTDMASPVNWLEKNGLVGDVCIMLTDGECNYAEKKPFPMITCVTTSRGSAPSWGKVIRMEPIAVKE